MIAACKAWGIAPPEYQLDSGVVTVTFRVPVVSGSNDPITTKTESAPKKTTEKTPLQVLVDNRQLTVTELVEHLNKSEPTIHRAIRKLRESGRLQRIGPAKGGYWHVVNDNKQELSN